MEDFNHFLIRNLSEIVIVETNRSEHRVVFETHYVVGLPPQFRKAVARRHRHRKHKPLRIAHNSSPRCSMLSHFWASNSTQANDGNAQLTARELEVLTAMADGATNKAIARRLGISFHTVKFHVAAIFEKLDADTRTEAVMKAAQLGIVML